MSPPRTTPPPTNREAQHSVTPSEKSKSWRKRRKEDGRCPWCARMVYTGGKLCDWCTEMSRARSLLFTRKKRGIPLDRPVRRVIPGVDRPLGQSRQRAWQLRRRAEGMCMNCGKPATTPKGYCQVCQDKRDSHERNRVRKQTPTNHEKSLALRFSH